MWEPRSRRFQSKRLNAYEALNAIKARNDRRLHRRHQPHHPRCRRQVRELSQEPRQGHSQALVGLVFARGECFSYLLTRTDGGGVSTVSTVSTEGRGEVTGPSTGGFYRGLPTYTDGRGAFPQFLHSVRKRPTYPLGGVVDRGAFVRVSSLVSAGRAVTTVTATPNVNNVTMVHMDNPGTCPVIGHLFHAVGGRPTSSRHRRPNGFRCNGVISPSSNSIVSSMIIACFHGPRDCANRSAVRVSYRNSSCVRRAVLRLLVTRNTHLTSQNRFAHRTFLGNGVSLSRTRTVTSLVGTRAGAARAVTLGRVHKRVAAGLSRLHSRLLGVYSLLRLRLSFNSRSSLRFTSHARLGRLTRAVRGRVRQLRGDFATNGTVGGNVPVTVVKRPGTNGSALLGRLLNSGHTVIDPVPNAAHSAVRSALGVGNMACHVVSATNLHRAASRVRGLNVRLTCRAVRGTRVIL